MRIKIHDFHHKWLDDLVYELYKFNRKTPMTYFDGISNHKLFNSKIAYLTKRLQKMMDSCKYNFIGIDETRSDDHKVYGFSCFSIKDNKCYNKLIFKSVDYPLSKNLFDINLEAFNRIKRLGFKEIYSIIDRPDEDRYIKFLKRFYNVEINKRLNKKTELIFNLENVLTN